MAEQSTLYFDFHGVSVQVSVDDAELLECLSFDFARLQREQSSNVDIRIDAFLAEVPTGKIPPVVASMHSPAYVCYDENSTRYVDYFGKALAIHHRDREVVEVYGEVRAFLYEKLYLIILSRVGELLDRRGIHRVHALGLATKRGASLILLPMHGGKSTLGLSLMREPGIKLMSDDTPLITRGGEVLPFLVRIGVREGDEPKEVPKRYTRSFSRENREPKTLISLDAFENEISAEEKRVPARLIIGKWTAAAKPELRKSGAFSAFRALLRDCVFGLGLPQVVEFFLQSTFRDTIAKSLIAASRVYASLIISCKSECYTLYLSRDRQANEKLIRELLRE